MSRSVLALLILAVGLGLYLWLIEMPAEQTRIQTETASKKLISFQESDVQTFILHSTAGDIEVARKDDGRGGWTITKPKAMEADPRAVEEFLRALLLAKVSRIVDETGTDLASYGLATPSLSVSLRLPSGTQTVLFGDPGPLSSSLYAKRDGDPKVFLTSISGREILTKGLQDFRRKRVLEFDHTRVSRLKVVTPHDTVVLYKEGHGEKADWKIKAPVEAPADQPEVRSLLFGLEDLKAQAFLDDAKDRQATKLQLKTPLVSLTVHEESGDTQPDGRDRTVMLFLNPKNTMTAYAETTPQEPIYIVPAATAKDLAKNLFALRSKQLIAAEPDRVKTLVIRRDEEEYSLIHEGSDWLVDGDPTAKADATRINTFMSRAVRLQAERIVTDKPKDLKHYGLAPPVAELTVADAQGKLLGRIAIGRVEDNLAFAQGSGMPGIFQIRPDLLKEIPKKTDLIASKSSPQSTTGGTR